jgi:hypothetical protein
MSRRLGGLADVDPLRVPLPHGTEVTTRVERPVFDRRVPQGMVGRVVRERDGPSDVLIIGVGELWYARKQLVPRKGGQLAFAHRREAAWQALRPCLVLEAVVGSRAWRLADADSDIDVRGAFALPFRFGQLFEILERARLESRLPEESPNAELERWLVEARLRWLERRSSTAGERVWSARGRGRAFPPRTALHGSAPSR